MVAYFIARALASTVPQRNSQILPCSTKAKQASFFLFTLLPTVGNRLAATSVVATIALLFYCCCFPCHQRITHPLQPMDYYLAATVATSTIASVSRCWCSFPRCQRNTHPPQTTDYRLAVALAAVAATTTTTTTTTTNSSLHCCYSFPCCHRNTRYFVVIIVAITACCHLATTSKGCAAG